MDTLYKHNSVFGWLNTFRILPTNVYLGRFGARPIAPPIISDPSLGQVFRNWNIADTGAFVTFYILGILSATQDSFSPRGEPRRWAPRYTSRSKDPCTS